MNEIIKAEGEKCMSEMCLSKPRFVHGACVPFAKNGKNTNILRDRRFKI